VVLLHLFSNHDALVCHVAPTGRIIVKLWVLNATRCLLRLLGPLLTGLRGSSLL